MRNKLIVLALFAFLILGPCAKTRKDRLLDPGFFLKTETVAEADIKRNIERKIRKGADVNARGGGGWTPLMLWAAFSYNSAIGRTLIDNGANVNARDNDGRTALMLWATGFFPRDNTDIGRILIDNGANVSAKDDNGQTALIYWAAFNGNPAIGRMLIDNGANVNAKDDDGLTALMYAKGRFRSVSTILKD